MDYAKDRDLDLMGYTAIEPTPYPGPIHLPPCYFIYLFIDLRPYSSPSLPPDTCTILMLAVGMFP